MRTRSKLLLAGLAATLALWAAVGTAGARRFELSEQHIRATWMEFTLTDTSLFKSVCPITIEGSFHSRTLSKVSGQLIGYITTALTDKNRCATQFRFKSLWFDEGGIANLPWHIRYDSFSGTLPAIVGIRLQLIEMGVKFEETTCEYKSEAAMPAYLRLALEGGRVTSIQWEESTRIRRINGGCLERGQVAGNGQLRVQGTTATFITVRLVA
jgi:hypothetical protein